MTETPSNYKYDLGAGIYLNAFSVDPALEERDLEALLSSKDGTAELDLTGLNQEIPFIGSVDSLADLKVNVDLERRYHVPQQLQAYREAVGKMSDAKGRYNGPVAMVDGPLTISPHFIPGGYYDFIATKLKAIPHDLVPDQYPAGKNVAELFNEWGVAPEERARYFGFSHLMVTDGGRELTFVQRAKNMAIAPDCISTSGSTPNPTFSPNFNFQEYCQKHLLEEMKEEFNLEHFEFQVGRLHLFDDKKEVPFAAVEIRTPLTTQVLAKRIYGNKQAIKEHPVIYSLPPEGIETLLKRFPVFPSVVEQFRTLAKFY